MNQTIDPAVYGETIRAVRKLIGPIAELRDDVELRQLPMDYLARIELLLWVEDRFDISISEPQAESWLEGTVTDLAGRITTAVQGQGERRHG